MTEPDDALLWAREEVARGFDYMGGVHNETEALHIRHGLKDTAHDISILAEAHRAGHAARDAEVETLRAENGRLLQLLAKAADTMGRAEATVNALIAALGVPPAPPKVAPWEAAFREWEKSGEDAADYQEVWQEAVEWCVGEAEKCKLPSVVFGEQYFSLDKLRRNIMGDYA